MHLQALLVKAFSTEDGENRLLWWLLEAKSRAQSLLIKISNEFSR